MSNTEAEKRYNISNLKTSNPLMLGSLPEFIEILKEGDLPLLQMLWISKDRRNIKEVIAKSVPNYLASYQTPAHFNMLDWLLENHVLPDDLYLDERSSSWSSFKDYVTWAVQHKAKINQKTLNTFFKNCSRINPDLCRVLHENGYKFSQYAFENLDDLDAVDLFWNRGMRYTEEGLNLAIKRLNVPLVKFVLEKDRDLIPSQEVVDYIATKEDEQTVIKMYEMLKAYNIIPGKQALIYIKNLSRPHTQAYLDMQFGKYSSKKPEQKSQSRLDNSEEDSESEDEPQPRFEHPIPQCTECIVQLRNEKIWPKPDASKLSREHRRAFESNFRKWALRNHPDKGESEEKFKTISNCKDLFDLKGKCDK